jgi:protein-tyrosine kinase
MMASALPGDGKTFTSINLALSMASERDVSVLLVDADIPKPHVSRIFGVEKEPGLIDALLDENIDVESLVLSTDVPGLDILPAGRSHEGAAELIASARMRHVVDRLQARHARRIVLFDSPPLLLSSESRSLVAVCAQVVMVVKSGQTPRQAVLNAISSIDESKPVSLVLNRGAATTDTYYGYGTQGSYGDRAG